MSFFVANNVPPLTSLCHPWGDISPSEINEASNSPSPMQPHILHKLMNGKHTADTFPNQCGIKTFIRVIMHLL